MAEEKKPNAIKTFLAKRGEWVALGVAGALLLVYFTMGVVLAKEDASIGELGKGNSLVNKAAAEAHPNNEKMKLPDHKDQVPVALGPWTNVVAARPGHDWLATLTPKPVGTPIEAEVIKVTPIVLPTFTLGALSVAMEGVTLAWNVVAISKADADKKGIVVAPIDYFKIEREIAGTGKWEICAEKHPAAQTTFKDEKIKPRTKYNYRLTAYTNDADYITKSDSTGKGTMVATKEPAVTIGIWKLKFINAVKDKAYMEIEKYDEKHGLVKIAHNHEAGERIGWWKDDSTNPLAKPVSKHSQTVKGVRAEIDYNTGMVLKSVTPEVTVEIKRQMCPIKIDGTGAILPHEPKEETITMRTTEIVYTDEDGKEQKVQSPDPRTRIQDGRCEPHGGPPKGGPPKDTTAKPGTPAGPAAPNREKEAEKILKDADDAAGAGAAFKPGAINMYQKLLNDYSDTQFVTKNKAKIEGKLQKLQE